MHNYFLLILYQYILYININYLLLMHAAFIDMVYVKKYIQS